MAETGKGPERIVPNRKDRGSRLERQNWGRQIQEWERKEQCRTGRQVRGRQRQEWGGKEWCRIGRDSVGDGKDRIGTAETGMGRERTVQNR